MKYLALFFLFAAAGLGFTGEEPKVLKPLENALWRGTLKLQATGHLYTQFLANKLNERGRIIGFTKEKGQFKIDFDLEISFLINDVGEYEFLAVETFEGDYYLNRQERHSFTEELKQERLNFKQKVQVAETLLTKIKYSQAQSYDREDFPHGNLRILPSGRLDKKGTITFMGEFEFPYEAEGKVLNTVERQPVKEGEKPKRTVARITKSINFPLAFEVKVAIGKKAVSGSIPVSTTIQDPFPKTDEDQTSSGNYKNALKLEGTYELTPLFSKNRK